MLNDGNSDSSIIGAKRSVPGSLRTGSTAGGACTTCRGKGVRGRVGLYEVIPIFEVLRNLICAKAPVSELEKAARAEGVQFLDDAARRRLLEGVTGLEEVEEFIRIET